MTAQLAAFFLASAFHPSRLISQVPGNLLAFEFPQKRLYFTFNELYYLAHLIAGFLISLFTSLRFNSVT
jgi:hypothetical protein